MLNVISFASVVARTLQLTAVMYAKIYQKMENVLKIARIISKLKVSL